MSHTITRRQACLTIPAAAAFALHAARPARAAGTPLADDIAASKKESHLEIYSNVGTLNWEIIVNLASMGRRNTGFENIRWSLPLEGLPRSRI